MNGKVDYVARAKSLMKKSARTTALVILPLVAAVQAQAITVSNLLTVQGPSCDGAGNGASLNGCSGGASQLGQIGPLTGTKLFGSGQYTLFSGTGAILAGGSAYLNISAFGLGAGFIAPGYAMPLGYNFTIGTSDIFSIAQAPFEVADWSATFSIQGTGLGEQGFNGASYVQTTVWGSGGGSFSGLTSLSFPIGLNLALPHWITAEFMVNFLGDGACVAADSAACGLLSIDVPENSIDFNTQAPAIPEPSSYALMAAGLAALGWRVRARKK